MYTNTEQIHLAYESACRHFSAKHNMTEIAKLCGFKRRQVLSNKLNPEQPHELKISELIALVKATNDTTLVDGLLLALDMCAMRLPPSRKDTTNNYILVNSALNMTKDCGELSKNVIKFNSKKPISSTKKNEIKQTALSLAKEALFFATEIERRFSASPVITAGFDMLSGGASAAFGM